VKKKKGTKKITTVEAATHDGAISFELFEGTQSMAINVVLESLPVKILDRATAEGVIEKLTKGLQVHPIEEATQILETRIKSLTLGVWVEKWSKK